MIWERFARGDTQGAYLLCVRGLGVDLGTALLRDDPTQPFEDDEEDDADNAESVPVTMGDRLPHVPARPR